ncbi:hypothetical protein [Flavobacterium covae]|uniref:hypothetical protein n=1 Tax=Flavobacterium covae TaxID=2906076 RepID=UPI00339B3F36
MFERNVFRKDYIKINDCTIVKIISFCFINELLEKVVTEKVLNIDDFFKGSEPIIEEFIFQFPEIPARLETAIASYGIDKRDFQCSK